MPETIAVNWLIGLGWLMFHREMYVRDLVSSAEFFTLWNWRTTSVWTWCVGLQTTIWFWVQFKLGRGFDKYTLARSSTSNRQAVEFGSFTGVLGVVAAWRETLLPVH